MEKVRIIPHRFEDKEEYINALVEAWKHNWEIFKKEHPRVAKRFEEAVEKHGSMDAVLRKFAEDIAYDKRRTRVQVPLTCRRYLYNDYGMSIKFYDDGDIVYARGSISSSVRDILGVC
ncbi:hypothetical protein [Thermococcus sp.]|uniref:hypothetical protein n=1 Tax=Thermococcus sp. TaxID=35749 RepID=UPI0026156A23|nr:hypothetical protein [Thermococcus sp.]